jgi:hypothetical protein
MKFRVGACALLVCLTGCSSEGTNNKFGDLVGSASPSAPGVNKMSPAKPARIPADSIANAPDLGALVSYRNKNVASKQEGAYTWYPIAISEDHALRAVATGEMVVPSPDGSQVKLRYERHVEHADGNWTWIGRVEGGDQMQEAILTFGERAVYGSIPQAAGAPALSLQTRAGQLWAVVTDPSKVVSANKGKNDVMVAPALALRASLASAAAKAQVTQNAVAAGAPATSANTIDVAIGYTQGFATAQGGQSAAVTRLNFLVEVGNQAFTNSLINGYLRIVNTVQVNYADDTANQTALGQLTGHNGTSAVTVPAALVPIRTARDQYGADLAVLVRKFQTPENDGCGIAWLNGADQTAISPTADDDFGFAVISDGNDTGTDGKSYFCAPETLVHELGHLMGSAHDRDNSTNDAGGLQYGRYAYSFGMKTDTANGNFYTIMAYGDDNQNFYRTFSNPLVVRCGPASNISCGVANQTDNARSLNQTIPVVATFRASVVPFKGVRSDFDGDGRSDIIWRNSADGRNQVWRSGNSGTQIATSTVSAQSWKVVGIGDFNADGPSDILWRDLATGRNAVWLSGNSATQQAATTIPPSGWIVAGVADFNGDGRSDILWRDTISGRNSIWLSGNSTTQQTTTSVPPSGWKVVGVDDFNGDGRADILWRDSVSGRNSIWLSGNSTTGQVVAAIPVLSWQVAGVGDFNADGRSDILWRNSADGRNQIWLSGNSTTQQAVATIASQDWKVVQVADFNGDGRSDVLWRNISTGANTAWFSANSSSTQNLSTVAGQSWGVVPN